MCFAKSDANNTPAILHSVISCELLAEVLQLMGCDCWNPQYLSHCGQLVELKVESPSSCTQANQYTANVTVLPQLFCTKQVELQYYRGRTIFPSDKLRNVLLFGGENWHPMADLTFILGDFSKEKDNLSPKLLLLTWHVTLHPPLLGSSNSLEEAQNVFKWHDLFLDRKEWSFVSFVVQQVCLQQIRIKTFCLPFACILD